MQNTKNELKSNIYHIPNTKDLEGVAPIVANPP